jgi:hypothetical protein
MRTLLLLLGLLTACAKRPHSTAALAAVSSTSPVCPVQVVPSPPGFGFTDSQQAVQEFDQSLDTAYVVLYSRQVAGFSGSNRCLLVRQRSATSFVVYKYEPQRIYSAQVTDTTWHRSLTQLAATPGHLVSLCFRATDTSLEYLVVKHQRKVVFSLMWEANGRGRLPVAEEVRLAPALALMRRFRD